MLGMAVCTVPLSVNENGLLLLSPSVMERLPLNVPALAAVIVTVNVVDVPAARLVCCGCVAVNPLGTVMVPRLSVLVPLFSMVNVFVTLRRAGVVPKESVLFKPNTFEPSSTVMAGPEEATVPLSVTLYG